MVKIEENNNVGIQELSEFLLDVSTTLMASGVHTSRVVRNITRIAESFGYVVDMTIFQKTIMMTTRKIGDDTVRRTSVRKIHPTAINFRIISEISTLSWKAYDNHLSIDQLRAEYNVIISRPRLSRWYVLFLVASANASFCRLFGGDVYAMGIVFVATLVAFFVRQELSSRHVNHMSIVVLCSFIASMIASVGLHFHIGHTPDIAVATSVLFLIPGVPLINSIIDILEGHVLAGISRSVNACILIICISLGLASTLFLLGVGL